MLKSIRNFRRRLFFRRARWSTTFSIRLSRLLRRSVKSARSRIPQDPDLLGTGIRRIPVEGVDNS